MRSQVYGQLKNLIRVVRLEDWNMQVILKDNVAGLGQKDDVKEVKSGYWRNFLLPQSLAVEVTPDLMKQAEKRKEEKVRREKEREEKSTEILKGLRGQTLKIEAKADEKGSLFAGIGAEKISEELKNQMGAEVPVDSIGLKDPIKKTGLHEICVKGVVLKIEIKPLEE